MPALGGQGRRVWVPPQGSLTEAPWYPSYKPPSGPPGWASENAHDPDHLPLFPLVFAPIQSDEVAGLHMPTARRLSSLGVLNLAGCVTPRMSHECVPLAFSWRQLIDAAGPEGLKPDGVGSFHRSASRRLLDLVRLSRPPLGHTRDPGGVVMGATAGVVRTLYLRRPADLQATEVSGYVPVLTRGVRALRVASTGPAGDPSYVGEGRPSRARGDASRRMKRQERRAFVYVTVVSPRYHRGITCSTAGLLARAAPAGGLVVIRAPPIEGLCCAVRLPRRDAASAPGRARTTARSPLLGFRLRRRASNG